MYGTDHAAPVPELAALVSRLNEVHEASNVRIGTLAEYVAEAPRADAAMIRAGAARCAPVHAPTS